VVHDHAPSLAAPPHARALFPHQARALQWFRTLFAQDLNGILADEMGLGKTMSAAAVLADLFHEAAQSKVQCLPAIIIAPLSTLDTWKSELAQSAAAALRVVVYNGDATARARVLDGNKFDIIITNPDVLVRGRTPPCAAPDCDTFCPDCDTFRLGSRAARAVAAHGVVLHGGRRGTQAEECRLVLARSAQRRLRVQAENAAYRYSRPQ
jgi:hypothetical protein